MENVKPIGEWVYLQPETTPKMHGSLHLPQNTKEKRCRGKVLAVGTGKVLESGVRVAPEVKPGDVVVYLKHNLLQGIARASDEDGPGLLSMTEILAVIEDVAIALPERTPAAEGAVL